jgi:hypothetical protein
MDALRASKLVALAIAFAVVLGVALFVVLYDEPTLRRKFGAEVRRILPECAALDTWSTSVESMTLYAGLQILRLRRPSFPKPVALALLAFPDRIS